MFFVVPLLGSTQGAFTGTVESAGGNDMGGHYLAGFARWKQLLRTRGTVVGPDSETGKGDGAAASPLVAHVDKDPLCPCDRASCAGGIARRAGIQQVVKLAATFLVWFSWFVLLRWTPFVTFAEGFWTTWWSALLGALCVLTLLFNFGPKAISTMSTCSALLGLPRRLGMRAANIAFTSFFERFGLALEGAVPEADLPSLLAGRELYVDLHHQTAAALPWGIGVPIVGGPLAFLSLAGFALWATANVAAGSCIPLAYIVFLLWAACFFLVDLSLTAVHNRSIDDLAGSYRDARQRIRLMLASAALRRPPPPAEIVDALRAHDAVLESFLGLERYRAGLFGFPVSFALLRTLVVTAATVVVGLWGILRGLGVFVTVETYCPNR
ncbi:hypothetical protein DFJ74DRAFT_673891 [Hyaloraphidium curvatum]|nr:hypothetical protein DFJ74DRAFT_673891 [Hyaloraphidium curvatum]